MAGSKLERFRDAHFPAEEDGQGALADEGAGRPARPVPPQRAAPAPRRSRRGPLGRVFSGLKLVLMLAPLAFLLLSSFAECGPRSSSLMPDVLRSAACARRDITRHAVSIEGTLRTVADRLR